jgi:Zn-dependent peptidase ImmA (M78 family)
LRYSPWADAARRYPDIHIERCDTAPARGVWVPSERVILINRELGYADRRAVLAHELAHIDLSHQPTRGWFKARQERDADRLAASRLLDEVHEIADAICAHPLDPAQVAEHLGVPLRVLRRRLANLTARDQGYIESRLAAREQSA